MRWCSGVLSLFSLFRNQDTYACVSWFKCQWSHHSRACCLPFIEQFSLWVQDSGVPAFMWFHQCAERQKKKTLWIALSVWSVKLGFPSVVSPGTGCCCLECELDRILSRWKKYSVLTLPTFTREVGPYPHVFSPGLEMIHCMNCSLLWWRDDKNHSVKRSLVNQIIFKKSWPQSLQHGQVPQFFQHNWAQRLQN